MSLIQKFITMRITSFNEKHFKEKGYKCNNGDLIRVKVKDLSKGSGVKVEVSCDYCGKHFFQAYRRYLEHPNDIACLDCRYNKVAKTDLQRYGNICSLRNSQVNEKAKATCKKHFGVEYALQSEEIRKKTQDALYENYNIEDVICFEENFSKIIKDYKNSEKNKWIPASKTQIYLCKIYKGILNYRISNFFIDIFLPEYNICCEYDGGGHNLSVKHGSLTQEEFDKKEIARNETLIKLGYKVFRIVSLKDKQLSKKDFLAIKQKAIFYLIEQNKDLYIYNIDTKSETIS